MAYLLQCSSFLEIFFFLAIFAFVILTSIEISSPLAISWPLVFLPLYLIIFFAILFIIAFEFVFKDNPDDAAEKFRYHSGIFVQIKTIHFCVNLISGKCENPIDKSTCTNYSYWPFHFLVSFLSCNS